MSDKDLKPCNHNETIRKVSHPYGKNNLIWCAVCGAIKYPGHNNDEWELPEIYTQSRPESPLVALDEKELENCLRIVQKGAWIPKDAPLIIGNIKVFAKAICTRFGSPQDTPEWLDEKTMYNFLMNEFAKAREKGLMSSFINGDSAAYVAKAICAKFGSPQNGVLDVNEVTLEFLRKCTQMPKASFEEIMREIDSRFTMGRLPVDRSGVKPEQKESGGKLMPDIRKITDENLVKELEKFEHETDISCFDCGAEYIVPIICWEDVAKFIRQCVKDSQKELIKTFEKLLSKQHAKGFTVGSDCYIHVNFQELKEAEQALREAMEEPK